MPRPAPAFGAGSATPVHAGMRTPAYPSATPMHPSMTPSHPGEPFGLGVGDPPEDHILVISLSRTTPDCFTMRRAGFIYVLSILLISHGTVSNRLGDAHARQCLGAYHGDAAASLIGGLQPSLALGRAFRGQGAVRLGRSLRSARWRRRGRQLDQRRSSAQQQHQGIWVGPGPPGKQCPTHLNSRSRQASVQDVGPLNIMAQSWSITKQANRS